MKLVIQRVRWAKVTVGGQAVSEIGPGLFTLLGVAKGDSEEALAAAIQKAVDLRIFGDAAGKMNLSLKDVQGEHLIVSQFTLLGDCSQGRRPSFMGAEASERAKHLYEKAIELSKAASVRTLGGIFGADMKIELLNDGPVTMILDFTPSSAPQ